LIALIACDAGAVRPLIASRSLIASRALGTVIALRANADRPLIALGALRTLVALIALDGDAIDAG
jgi:hypothetical protein